MTLNSRPDHIKCARKDCGHWENEHGEPGGDCWHLVEPEVYCDCSSFVAPTSGKAMKCVLCGLDDGCRCGIAGEIATLKAANASMKELLSQYQSSIHLFEHDAKTAPVDCQIEPCPKTTMAILGSGKKDWCSNCGAVMATKEGRSFPSCANCS